jgi:hypothetical protein
MCNFGRMPKTGDASWIHLCVCLPEGPTEFLPRLSPPGSRIWILMKFYIHKGRTMKCECIGKMCVSFHLNVHTLKFVSLHKGTAVKSIVRDIR